jgi:hypothetical protein
MDNCKFHIDHDQEVLTITVDLKQRNGLSVSGQNVRIASTEGNVELEGRKEKVNLNVFIKLKDNHLGDYTD